MSSSTVVLTVTLALAIGILLQTSTTNGECCGYRSRGVGCCGKGPCNIFCCNCDGGCFYRQDGCYPDDAKRSVHAIIQFQSQSADEYEITRNSFDNIDVNKDNFIDLNEGLSYFLNYTEPSRTQEFAIEFGAMDTNGNGLIEPQEFDSALV